MKPGPLKLAKDLVPGDRVLVSGRPNTSVPMTVLAVVPSVQTIRRKVLLVTLRDKDGHDCHRTFAEQSTIRPASL